MENTNEKPKRSRRKKEEATETAVEAPVIDSKTKEAAKPTGYTVKVVASLLNVRERPEAMARIAGTVSRNEKLVVTDELDDGWGKLEKGGYVLLKFTERIDD